MDNITNSMMGTVMGVFKSFGGTQKYKVKLTKIGCVDGHPPKIPIGQIVEGVLASEARVGLSFNIANAIIKEGGSDSPKNTKGVEYDFWCTSIIQKILSDDTFQTKNSIYKFELYAIK